MRLFFVSKIPAFVKINGELLIKINENLIFTDYDDEIFLLEILPTNPNFEPIFCEFKENKQLKIFDFLNGKLIFPTFNRKRNHKYQVVYQKRFSLLNSEHLLSVISDGSIKFYLDGTFILTDELPFIPVSCDIKAYNNFLILSFTNKLTALFVYHIQNDKLVLSYKDIISEFSFDNVLTTKKQIFTPINAVLVENWEFSNPLKILNVSLNSNFSIYSINKHLIPLFFFETFKYGYVETSILSDNLKERIKDLLSFVGTPICVFPHPYNIEKTVVITENLVNIYSLEFNNNLITNILEN